MRNKQGVKWAGTKHTWGNWGFYRGKVDVLRFKASARGSHWWLAARNPAHFFSWDVGFKITQTGGEALSLRPYILLS